MKTPQKVEMGSSTHLTPQFKNENELSFEQRNNPDYRLEMLEKMFGNKIPISCSKCHHCR